MVSFIFDGKERIPRFDGPRRTVPVRKCLNCEKAFNILGWQPSIPLAQGLEETIRWYRLYWPRLLKRVKEELSLVPQAAGCEDKL